jgi:transposase
VRALVAVLVVLNEQIRTLQGQVEAHFGGGTRPLRSPLSQPGLGPTLGARVLAEFGDAPDRYLSAKTRKNYAATSPITRASGKKKVAAARYVHNDRLIDALMAQAFATLTASPDARAYYDQARARGAEHNPALHQLAHRHPARLPQDQHPLQRGNRMVASCREGCRLTVKLLGCLSTSVAGRPRESPGSPSRYWVAFHRGL